MAGIYLHIPFCKGKCAYCDFYSVGNIKLKEIFIEAICKEIELQKDYLKGESIQTIYFGGGTPSLLSPEELEEIIEQILKYFDVEKSNEITLEANPDDLSREYLKAIKEIGINRLSVGIQSFNNDDLRRMKRKHSADQAIRSVRYAQEQGFKSISIDLLYGLPDLNLQQWEKNIEQALNLDIQHISAYYLTIEPKTLFYRYYQKNNLNLPSEDESLNQFGKLIEKTEQKGFLHYEISNFAKDGFLSLHNTNYWRGIKYLGLGPSAHSYNLTSRQWNIQNLRGYLDEIFKGKIPCEEENLSKNEKFNDYLITSLRTMWGLNTEKIEHEFGIDFKKDIEKKSRRFLKENFLIKSGNNFKLTKKGIFISDHIILSFLKD